MSDDAVVPAAPAPVISVVTVNWNVKQYLLDCVRSVEEGAGSLPFEHIVVDNASTDGSMAELARLSPDTVLIHNDENRGFSVANNQGARVARGEFFVFLNPDTIVRPNALANMVEVMRANPEIGVLGPRLVDEHGRFSKDMGHRAPSMWTVINSYMLFSNLSQHFFPGISRNRDVRGLEYCDWVCGACLMTRREVSESFEWDEAIFLQGEDIEYCLPIGEAGWRLACTGDAEVVHYAGRSFAKQRLEFLVGTPSATAIQLTRRHGFIGAAIGIGGMRLGMRMRQIVHDALHRMSGNPEQLYKANKLRQLQNLDDWSQLRAAKESPVSGGGRPGAEGRQQK